MCDRLDEINDNSDDSIYYINHQNNNIIKNNNDVNNIGNILLTRMDNEKYDRPTSPSRPLGRSSSTKGIYVNSIFDSMDPEVAQALLEWRRQSLLKIDWSNMFAVKSELWRSSNLFHFLSIEQQQQQSPEHCHQHQLLQPQQQHHLDLPSSQSSIATSLISLDFKGVSLDKAFRSYSTRIDYAKASVLEIDQALQVFAQLYWECNPTKLFRCAELVYIVIHSLMQLNTDIHAGKEHIAMDSFCDQTIQTILSHQASIPIMLFDSDGETTWQQQMTDCLKLLYKSIQRSSLLPKEQVQPTSTVIEKEFDDQPNDEQCLTENQLDTAFDNLFISVPETSNNNNVISNPTMSTTILQKQQQQHRRRRSNSLYSTPSWTLLRRRDTYRTKIGPYKEGPLSCQVNDEKWRICWVILQQGHLHIYHQHEKTEFPIHTTTTSTSSLTSDINNKNKIKKKFMHHIAPSSTSSNNSGANASHGNIHNNGQLKKTEPYQEVDIHLGNTFCEKAGAHVFILKLANGSIYIFDCGSESQVNLWIRDCNYWAAIETKIVPSRGISSHSSLLESSSLSISSWKRPPPPAGASVLDKIGQQKAIDAQLDYLQNELKLHLQQPGWSNSTWQDKKMYLELEIRKYQCYQNVIYQ
ncbi:uncharacterized protein BX664DRAFT_319086 [Halteromyces radiatus]|uniref:uncharacterized protein n=1 Tax=Halteromyces radiatus TaxID=101107 RepID=UPI00221FA819|nr:uncharacterized protein BX664DRAFT_319086 [Halteromyces radiatus]KAI8098590.1 hypothetical protein BX664DRAFT_319086 [Halteromyces radiatus]